MFNGKNKDVIAILTQERYLRLLQYNEELKFNRIIIDEAHNLLECDNKYESRSILLASLIILSKKRFQNTLFYFLTPNVNEPNNLLPKYINIEPEKHIIDEIVKSEIYYFYDIRKKHCFLYEQYLNEFITIQNNRYLNDFEIILKKGSKKNIIYLNKLKDVQNVAITLANKLNNIDNSKIESAIADLKKFVHKDYDLIKCLKKGVIYHHGSIPENIRKFIENLYTEVEEIKFIVTTSTLLEGVNLPATSLFILEPKKGRKNLILVILKIW